MRLPDFYYTSQILDGTEPKDGIKQPSPSFPQGDDIVLSFYINYNGMPIITSEWALEAIVKKNPGAATVLWRGILGVGLWEKEGIPGYFSIIMANDVSAQFLAGTYYLDIKGVQKIGTGENVRDLTVTLLSTTFNIYLTASSPSPKLRPGMVTSVTVDAPSGVVTVSRTSVEPTLPDSTDTTAL
jgi:hypothetical protein